VIESGTVYMEGKVIGNFVGNFFGRRSEFVKTKKKSGNFPCTNSHICYSEQIFRNGGFLTMQSSACKTFYKNG